MKEATQLTAVYVALFLILSTLVFSSLKSCSEQIDQDAERAAAYQLKFQNANEHEVYVRQLGDK